MLIRWGRTFFPACLPTNRKNMFHVHLAGCSGNKIKHNYRTICTEENYYQKQSKLCSAKIIIIFKSEFVFCVWLLQFFFLTHTSSLPSLAAVCILNCEMSPRQWPNPRPKLRLGLGFQPRVRLRLTPENPLPYVNCSIYAVGQLRPVMKKGGKSLRVPRPLRKGKLPTHRKLSYEP